MTTTATALRRWRVYDTHTGQTIATTPSPSLARGLAATFRPRLVAGSGIRRWAVERA